MKQSRTNSLSIQIQLWVIDYFKHQGLEQHEKYILISGPQITSLQFQWSIFILVALSELPKWLLFPFCNKILERWLGRANEILSICEYSLSG